MLEFFQRHLLALASWFSKKLSKIYLPYSRKMVTGEDYYKLLDFLEPGLVLVAKSNGELSNIFIPEFWGHAAIVSVDTKYVVEATTHGVVKTDIVSFMMNKDCVGAFVPLFTSKSKMKRAAEVAEEQIGKDYDFEFSTSSIEKFYCSELVWYAYDQVIDDIPFKPRVILGQESIAPSDFELATDKFKSVWYSKSNEVLR